MDEAIINSTIQAIATVGFPIVACCVMFYLNWKEQKDHKEESEKWVAALDKNTAVIDKLMERLK